MFIAPKAKATKADIKRNEERKGAAIKGKKRARKIRDERKLNIAPPALYRTTGKVGEYSGGAMRH